MEKPRTKILNYINVFRGLAILLIIMGHTMQFGDNSTLINNINCEMICGGTALFIFISGFLFQHLSSKFEYKNYLSKKWTNVIMPYLITSIPGLFFCLYCPVAYKNSFAGLDPLIQIPLHLTIGRVHNIPTWFIPMIIIFFIFSWVFLKLEKKNFLYKLLPLLFILTIIIPRGVAEYESTIGLDYLTKYYVYVKYILSNFVHFLSLYVFGMYCSSKKEVIDEFYKKRWGLWVLMISFASIDIYLQMNYQYSNYTISKIFLTMLVLGYLKHYDEFILSHKKTNKTLDFIAKYSFGLFFIHWYWFFIYNQIFNLPTVAPVIEGDYFVTILFVIMRFFAVALMSILSLFICKKVLTFFNKEINTRKFLGI